MPFVKIGPKGMRGRLAVTTFAVHLTRDEWQRVLVKLTSYPGPWDGPIVQSIRELIDESAEYECCECARDFRAGEVHYAEHLGVYYCHECWESDDA